MAGWERSCQAENGHELVATGEAVGFGDPSCEAWLDVHAARPADPLDGSERGGDPTVLVGRERGVRGAGAFGECPEGELAFAAEATDEGSWGHTSMVSFSIPNESGRDGWWKRSPYGADGRRVRGESTVESIRDEQPTSRYDELIAAGVLTPPSDSGSVFDMVPLEGVVGASAALMAMRADER